MYGFIGIIVRVAVVLIFEFNAGVVNAQIVFHRCTTCQEGSRVVTELPVLGGKRTRHARHVTVFIILGKRCSSCAKAMRDISTFKRNHPSWKVDIIVSGSLRQFKYFLKHTMRRWPLDLQYGWDDGTRLAANGITRSPSYIIEYDGRRRKVQGYVALGDYVSLLGS